MISSADAALVLSKFETEATPLRVTFSVPDNSIYLVLKAQLGAFTEGEHLCLLTQTKEISLISLKGCKFEYGDGRALPELLREWATQKYEGTLTILFPSDERLTLAAFRLEPPSDV